MRTASKTIAGSLTPQQSWTWCTLKSNRNRIESKDNWNSVTRAKRDPSQPNAEMEGEYETAAG